MVLTSSHKFLGNKNKSTYVDGACSDAKDSHELKCGAIQASLTNRGVAAGGPSVSGGTTARVILLGRSGDPQISILVIN